MSQPSRKICIRLDGLPLARQLAAPRLKTSSPALLLERLSRRLDMAGDARDAPDRQRTLRATIDWSYELPQPPEQDLFRRLAVFRGSFSSSAAHAVGQATQVDVLQDALQHPLGLEPCPAHQHGSRSAEVPDAGDDPRVRRRAAVAHGRRSDDDRRMPPTSSRWPSRPSGSCAAPISPTGCEPWGADNDNLRKRSPGSTRRVRPNRDCASRLRSGGSGRPRPARGGPRTRRAFNGSRRPRDLSRGSRAWAGLRRKARRSSRAT